MRPAQGSSPAAVSIALCYACTGVMDKVVRSAVDVVVRGLWSDRKGSSSGPEQPQVSESDDALMWPIRNHPARFGFMSLATGSRQRAIILQRTRRTAGHPNQGFNSTQAARCHLPCPSRGLPYPVSVAPGPFLTSFFFLFPGFPFLSTKLSRTSPSPSSAHRRPSFLSASPKFSYARPIRPPNCADLLRRPSQFPLSLC